MADTPRTEYQFTAGLPRDFQPTIYLLDPADVVLQGMNGADGRTVIASEPAMQKKVEWQDEELLRPHSELNGGIDNAVTTITLPDNSHRLRFQTGDIIKVGDEHMLVTDYGSGTGELDVTRGYQGTSAASHSDGDRVTGLGAALPEGSDPQEVRALDRTDRHNFTQIFGPTAVQISGTKQATRRFGVPAGQEFNHQAARRTMEHWIQREQAFFYGIRWEDTSEERRTTGGLDYFITTNVDSSTTTLTYSAVRTQLQNIFDAGGRADRLVCPVSKKATIDDFDSGDIRLVRRDNGRGQMVDVLQTSYGEVSVIMSREVENSDVFIYPRDNVKQRPLRPVQFVPLSRTGDAEKGMLVSEAALQVEGERHCAKFDSLS